MTRAKSAWKERNWVKFSGKLWKYELFKINNNNNNQIIIIITVEASLKYLLFRI